MAALPPSESLRKCFHADGTSSMLICRIRRRETLRDAVGLGHASLRELASRSRPNTIAEKKRASVGDERRPELGAVWKLHVLGHDADHRCRLSGFTRRDVPSTLGPARYGSSRDRSP